MKGNIHYLNYVLKSSKINCLTKQESQEAKRKCREIVEQFEREISEAFSVHSLRRCNTHITRLT